MTILFAITYAAGAFVVWSVICQKEPLPTTRSEYALHALVAAFWLPAVIGAGLVFLERWYRDGEGSR